VALLLVLFAASTDASAAGSTTLQGRASFPPASSLQPPASTPPDCLIAGRFDDVKSLCDRLGEILSAMDGSTDGKYLLGNVGAKLRNPAFAGVNLSAPIRFFLMSPKKFSDPWVFQFGVTDADALKKAIKRHGAEGEAGHLYLRGSQATWSLNEAAAATLRSWQESHPGATVLRASGQLSLRLHVLQIMEQYEEEVVLQARRMKARMRQALDRREEEPINPQEVSAAETELDAVIALLRQVADVDLGIEMTREYGRISLDAATLPGTPLRGLVTSHPTCSMELGNCPGDAMIVVAHNIALMNAVRNMVVRALGLGSAGLFQQRPAAQSGHTVLAAFISPAAEAPLEVLELCDGARALAALGRWQRFEAPDSTGRELPFVLRPLPVEQADDGVLRLAAIVLNESVLGPAGMQAAQRLFGPNPKAVLSLHDGRSASAVGRSPLRHIRQVMALHTGKGQSLRSNPSFSHLVAGTPDHPNFLVYVSPDGIRNWLKLAGLTPDEPRSDERGLIGWARFTEQGQIAAAVRIPTAALRRALRSQNDE